MVCTVCHCQQSDQGLQCLPFAAVWSVSTLFSILRLISIYSICHSKQSVQGLHYLPFLLISIINVYTTQIRVSNTCHSQQSDQGQGLHCHSQENSDQGLYHLPFQAFSSRSALFASLSCLIKVYTVCLSQQSDQGLHYLPFSAVW